MIFSNPTKSKSTNQILIKNKKKKIVHCQRRTFYPELSDDYDFPISSINICSQNANVYSVELLKKIVKTT